VLTSTCHEGVRGSGGVTPYSFSLGLAALCDRFLDPVRVWTKCVSCGSLNQAVQPLATYCAVLPVATHCAALTVATHCAALTVATHCPAPHNLSFSQLPLPVPPSLAAARPVVAITNYDYFPIQH
jgi:hypothetical protein